MHILQQQQIIELWSVKKCGKCYSLAVYLAAIYVAGPARIGHLAHKIYVDSQNKYDVSCNSLMLWASTLIDIKLALILIALQNHVQKVLGWVIDMVILLYVTECRRYCMPCYVMVVFCVHIPYFYSPSHVLCFEILSYCLN